MDDNASSQNIAGSAGCSAGGFVDPHVASDHDHAHTHHHHMHAATSHHAGGHHLLQVEHLGIGFTMYDEAAGLLHPRRVFKRVIHDLSIAVHAGEIVAVVGASGSGKTLLADAIMGIFEPNATVQGTIWFDGVQQDAAGLRSLRGHGLSYVPQGVAALDPTCKVGKQVAGWRSDVSTKAGRSERIEQVRHLFENYDLPEDTLEKYPFELSGGMARRVLLCCALMDDPRVIVADEPTPGLDLDLAIRALDDFRAFADQGGGVLLITHDIELALQVADRVAVFRDGTVIEETAVADFEQPDTLDHPFSRALWHALPEHDFTVEGMAENEDAEAGDSDELASTAVQAPLSPLKGGAPSC